jgi:hypothetical protein
MLKLTKFQFQRQEENVSKRDTLIKQFADEYSFDGKYINRLFIWPMYSNTFLAASLCLKCGLKAIMLYIVYMTTSP